MQQLAQFHTSKNEGRGQWTVGGSPGSTPSTHYLVCDEEGDCLGSKSATIRHILEQFVPESDCTVRAVVRRQTTGVHCGGRQQAADPIRIDSEY